MRDRPEERLVTITENARCAGTRPARELHPGIAEVMNEIGVSMADAFPKPLTEEVVEAADVVVTMGCGDACPVLPGRRYEDWALPDPLTMRIDHVRALRDEIDRRIQALLASLAPSDVPVLPSGHEAYRERRGR